MEFSVQNIYGLLIRSKLLAPDEVKAAHQRWLSTAKDATNSRDFLRTLVAGGQLTEYQANLLGKGHADDFFLNQYRILDRLGQGRMAGVYKAQHQLGQTVAIKVLPPSRAKEAYTLARFQREATLSMKLKHPNVVRSFQVGEARGLNYLVMEHLDGETLEEVLHRRKRLPPNEAVRVLHQALTGLQHIHEQGLIHRDLKPGNLMLVPGHQAGEPDTTLQATVKILDIGLGRQLFDENAPTPPESSQLTREGAILGTPAYLAPEQARNAHAVDIRADIYSLGCVLFQCLTGQTPFADTNVLNQMIRHATETPRALKELNPTVPDGLQLVVSTMLAKDPAQRYPTPERAAQALQPFLTAGTTAAKPLEEVPQMRRYLTWLETGKDDGGKAPEALAAQPTAVSTREGHRHKHKKHRQKAKGGDEKFDVELVAVPPPGGLSGPGTSRLGLTRRDWTLLGIGAGAVIVAVAIGMGLALLLQ
jgi:serine/threonine protein kinase